MASETIGGTTGRWLVIETLSSTRGTFQDTAPKQEPNQSKHWHILPCIRRCAKTKCTNSTGSHSISPRKGMAVRLRCCRTSRTSRTDVFSGSCRFQGVWLSMADEQMGHSPLSFPSQGIISSSTARQIDLVPSGKEDVPFGSGSGQRHVDMHHCGPRGPGR